MENDRASYLLTDSLVTQDSICCLEGWWKHSELILRTWAELFPLGPKLWGVMSPPSTRSWMWWMWSQGKGHLSMRTVLLMLQVSHVMMRRTWEHGLEWMPTFYYCWVTVNSCCCWPCFCGMLCSCQWGSFECGRLPTTLRYNNRILAPADWLLANLSVGEAFLCYVSCGSAILLTLDSNQSPCDLK